MSLRIWREALREDVTIAPASKLVGFIVSTYAEQDGKTASPGHLAVAANTGHSRKYVLQSFKQLQAAGYLTKVHTGHGNGPYVSGKGCGHPGTYELHLPPNR